MIFYILISVFQKSHHTLWIPIIVSLPPRDQDSDFKMKTPEGGEVNSMATQQQTLQLPIAKGPGPAL